MHFPIIEINSEKDGKFSLDFEDSTLNYFTDYYGEEYTEYEREKVLNAQWFHDLFKGLAEVIPGEGILRIFDEDTIRKTLDEYYNHVIEKLQNLDETSIWRRFYEVRNAGFLYDDYPTLFYYDGAGYTSMQFIEDLCHVAGSDLYIGRIYDAHI